MDSKRYEKARSIDFALGHIRGSIQRIKDGGHVFCLNESHQNVIDRDMLKEIQVKADEMVLAVLNEQKAELEKEFAEL